MRTIFRNEKQDVYLKDENPQVKLIVTNAKAKGLYIFSDKTDTWESLYWNVEDNTICGCNSDKALFPDRITATSAEFLAEIEKPKKKIKEAIDK